MELIDQPLSSAIVAESLSLSKTPVAQEGVTDKWNPVFQLQGQLEMKLVSICWTKLRSWPSDCWNRGKLGAEVEGGAGRAKAWQTSKPRAYMQSIISFSPDWMTTTLSSFTQVWQASLCLFPILTQWIFKFCWPYIRSGRRLDHGQGPGTRPGGIMWAEHHSLHAVTISFWTNSAAPKHHFLICQKLWSSSPVNRLSFPQHNGARTLQVFFFFFLMKNELWPYRRTGRWCEHAQRSSLALSQQRICALLHWKVNRRTYWSSLGVGYVHVEFVQEPQYVESLVWHYSRWMPIYVPELSRYGGSVPDLV